MIITKLVAENVKRLQAVAISPDGAVVRIAGNNGQGKSSVLDSIAYALGGEKLCPAEPIRRGAKDARVVLEFDEDLVVERRWTAAGTRLEVRSKAGARFRSPQDILNGLVGKLSFDPLEFMRLKPEIQAETLRRLAGIDFSLMEAKRKVAYDQRTVANRQVQQLKARLAPMPVVEVTPDVPEEFVSGAALLEEHQRRQKEKGANDLVRAGLQRAKEIFVTRKRELENATAEVVRARQALEAAEERQRIAEANLEAAHGAGKTAQDQVEQLVDPDLEEIPRKLRTVESTNDLIRRRQDRQTIERELAAAEREAAEQDAAIAAIDQQKEEALAQAKFPVDGLAFSEAGVSLNGLPLEQASAAEQLRVSLAMGISLNPKMKVLLIRDASLLDEKSMALVAGMAERAGAQVWLEVVGKGGSGIVIEDGQVEGAALAEASHVAV